VTTRRRHLNACSTFQPFSSRGFDLVNVCFNATITTQIIMHGGPQLVGNMVKRVAFTVAHHPPPRSAGEHPSGHAGCV
jgi:hypothetical protein